MSDEEDYSSSDDEDYVPSDGEAVSEEENSGDEENLEALKEDGETVITTKRKRKPQKQLSPRKRKGGIRLEGESEEAAEDSGNKELEEQIEKEKEARKAESEKKKAEDLWASFMSDVGRPGPKKTQPSATSNPLSSLSRPIASTNKPTVPQEAKPKENKITVTKVYDFAGEAVKVTKELDVNSKEGKAELKRQKEEEDQKQKPAAAAAAPKPAGLMVGASVKKPGMAGLGGLLDKINKKPKMGTLEKSKLDWEVFKEKEGISEELKIHNRGKNSYIERMNFLQRTDQKQFEMERDLRLSSSSKR